VVPKAPKPAPAPKAAKPAKKPESPKTETVERVTFIPPATTIREREIETDLDQDGYKGKIITKVTEVETDLDADDEGIDDFKIPGEKIHDWGEILTREEEEDDEDDDDELDSPLF